MGFVNSASYLLYIFIELTAHVLLTKDCIQLYIFLNVTTVCASLGLRVTSEWLGIEGEKNTGIYDPVLPR